MSLLLYIDTSVRDFNILLVKNNEILFSAANDIKTGKRREIGQVLTNGLSKINAKTKDINSIAVNVGPGPTNAIRSGVSFSNSLAYGLKIPVARFSSFELMGYDAWKKTGLPVICTAKAISGNVYFGIFNGEKVTDAKFGQLDEIFETTNFDAPNYAVAGQHREVIIANQHGVDCMDSEVLMGNPEVLLELEKMIFDRSKFYPDIIKPITESLIFY